MKKIVLLRHGESIWNKENRFTGWTDVDLTEKGIEEDYRYRMTAFVCKFYVKAVRRNIKAVLALSAFQLKLEI